MGSFKLFWVFEKSKASYALSFISSSLVWLVLSLVCLNMDQYGSDRAVLCSSYKHGRWRQIWDLDLSHCPPAPRSPASSFTCALLCPVSSRDGSSAWLIELGDHSMRGGIRSAWWREDVQKMLFLLRNRNILMREYSHEYVSWKNNYKWLRNFVW